MRWVLVGADLGDRHRRRLLDHARGEARRPDRARHGAGRSARQHPRPRAPRLCGRLRRLALWRVSVPFSSSMSPMQRLALASPYCYCGPSWLRSARRRMPNMRKLVPLVAAFGGRAQRLRRHSAARPQAPDEFQVARNAPLVIPPDYTLDAAGRGHRRADPAGRSAAGDRRLVRRPGAAQPERDDTCSSAPAATARRSALARPPAIPDTRVVDKGPVTTAILNAPEADGQVASAQVPQ